jgi:Raf kinase inhibitor-like YbhB/YbcL family protein
MSRTWRGSVVLVGLLLASCSERGRAGADGPPPEGSAMTTMTITIESPAFADGGPIPVEHTDDGEDISPALSWSGLPDGTRQVALICDDPDAPTDTPWVHWVIYGIPPGAGGLPEAVPTTERLAPPLNAVQGVNSWNATGYRGPAPPRGHGTHHYHFKLYALDTALDLAPDLDKEILLRSIEGHVLAEGELVGTYER